MCFFIKKEKEIINRINSIISEFQYQIVLYKKKCGRLGKTILKLISPKKNNLKFIINKNELIFNGNSLNIPNDLLHKNVEETLLEIVSLVFNIIQSDDWRLTGQEDYLLFEKLYKLIPSEYMKSLKNPEFFHEHCEFCMVSIDEHPNEECYCTTNKYRWLCKQCFLDFNNYFKFKVIDNVEE